MAGPMVGPLLERLGLDLVETYWSPTAIPRPRAQPAAAGEPRSSSSTRSRDEGADLGIAWDGDADRCFFIDDTGAFVDGDFLTALLAESLLREAARARTILYDVRASRAVADTVEARRRHARSSTASATRSSRRRMRDEGALFGGEVSGHYYFRDFYNADSGTIPALLILELLSREGATLSRAARALPRDVLHLRRDQLRGRRPGRRRWRRSRSATPTRDQRELDGISVDYDDWHFNVRPSNTEPLLRLCLESLSRSEDMERRRDEVLGLIRS